MTTRRGTRFTLCCLAALLPILAGISPSIAATTDTVGPVASDFDFSPKTVDVAEGSKSVVVSVRLTDGTGVSTPTVLASSDSTDQSAGFGSMRLMSGTYQDGIWSKSITIPSTAAPGSWSITLYPLTDVLGNGSDGFTDHPSKLTVQNKPGDTVGPVASDFDFSPKTVDVAEGSKSVVVSVRLTDETGVSTPTVLASSDSTDQSAGFGSMKLMSGTYQDGIWSKTITIPSTAAAGLWSITLYPLSDSLGNRGDGFTDHPSKLKVRQGPTVPSVPGSPTAVGDDGKATVTWTEPDDNGSPVTSFTITSIPGGLSKTVTADSTSTSMAGLTNGTVYTFSVAATNKVGTSRPSAPSNKVTPAGVPAQPGKPIAVRGDSSATVSWTKPSGNGAPVTGYILEGAPGGLSKRIDDPDATSTTVSGLTNGTVYSFTIRAMNSVGASSVSESSNEVVPAGVAARPSKPSVERGDKSARVSWDVPDASVAHGAPITRYVVTSSPGGATTAVDGVTTSTTVVGLTNGTAYTFTVEAINAIGSSDASERSMPVTPAGSPAKASLRAIRGDRSVNLSWSRPASNGSAISGYTIVDNNGKKYSATATATSLKVSSLTNGRAYRFTLVSENAVGSSAASSSVSATPAGRPGTPARPSAKAGKRYATISWKAPSSNGTAITSYKIRRSDGATKAVKASARSYRWTSLKTNKKYSFKVYAVNGVGTSAGSSSSSTIKVK